MKWFWEDKEYYGGQFISLAEPDYSIRAAKKQVMYNTDDLPAFNKQYWNWKHSYRKRYSEDKMNRYGFKPIVYGQAAYDSTSEINAYMLARDPLYHHLINTRSGYIDLYSVMANYLQWNGYAYSIKKQELNVNGTIYNYKYVGFLENPDPALPDDYSTGIGTFESSTGAIFTVAFPNAYGNIDSFQVMYVRDAVETENTEYYIYIAPTSEVPFEVRSQNDMVLSAIVPVKERGVMEEEDTNMRLMLGKFGVSIDDFDELLEDTDDDGEAAIDNAYVLNALPLQNPYEILAKTYDSEAAAALPRAFLKELDRRGYYEENSDGTGEYVVTEEFAEKWRRDHFREQAYMSKALFRTFAYYSNSMDMAIYDAEPYSMLYMGNSIADKMNINSSELSVRSGWFLGTIKFDISIVTKSGTVRGHEGVTDKRSQADFHFSGTRLGVDSEPEEDDEDRESEATWDSQGYDQLVIKVQKNETQYQEMTITGYKATYGFEDKTFIVGLGHPPTESRLLLPYFILQDVRFTEFVTINEHSFSIFAYMKKIVDFDWGTFVQTAVFAVILCVGTYGAGCGAAAALYAAASAVVMQALWLQIMTIIDNDMLFAIMQVAYSLYQMYSGNFDISTITAENYLPLANKALGIASKAYGIVKAKEAEDEAEDDRKIKSQEGIDESIDNISEAQTIIPKAIMSAHYSFKDANNPDAYYNNLLNGIFNFDQFYNVDGELELRKQVVSG